MNILVINGPNLDKLGERDSQKYGGMTLANISQKLSVEFPDDSFSFIRSDLEGELISAISTASGRFEGVILNPGGYAHTSVALRDAIEISKIPVVEVHLSNLSARENFRQNLLTASVCTGYVSGFKHNSYLAAAYILHKLKDEK